MSDETITAYDGLLTLDEQPVTIKVRVSGLAHEHKRDSGTVRRKMRDVLATARKMNPEVKVLSLTIRISGGTDLREEMVP